MAEAVVVSSVLTLIGDLLLAEAKTEVKLLAGVGNQVKELERQLKEMKCLLEDADKKRHESRTMFNLISEIKDLAYRSESTIERHAVKRNGLELD